MSSPAETVCPACGSVHGRAFYRVDSIPVHSVLLMDSRDEAREYPRRELELWFCEDCGFIHNRRFDASVHEYSPKCEESQAFSGTFNKFAAGLAKDYIERYEPKTALEIGCGKGDFLVGLCELSDCKGIGIDPGLQPERIESSASDRLEWIVDFYDERYKHLQADLVLCRHTLEHIGPVADFMRGVRGAVGDDPSTVVAFELPDVETILIENGFWDIYYEHCSYFTLGSLSRLFEHVNLTPHRLEKCFDDQYLLIDSRPGEAKGGLEAAEDLERTRQQVTAFEKGVQTTMASWRDFVTEAHQRGEKTILWGSGSKAVAFLTTLGFDEEIACMTDINPYRHDKFVPGSGHEIVPPQKLRDIKPDNVIVMNPIYLEEIGKDLAEMGLTPHMVAVGPDLQRVRAI